MSENITQSSFEKETQSYLEREPHLDVSSVMKEKNCYFVHMIQVTDVLDVSENNEVLDTKKLSTQDRLDLLYAASPTLSTSSLRPRTTDGTFYGGFGVVFSQGEIMSAHATDVGSKASSLTERSGMGIEKNTPEDVASAIDREQGADKSYNEIVLKSPEVAGGFLKIDSLKDRITYEEVTRDYGSGGGEQVEEHGVLNLSNEVSPRGELKRSFDKVVKTLEDMKFYGPVFIMDTNNELHQIIDLDLQKRVITFKTVPILPPQFSETYSEQKMDNQTKEALRDRLARRGVLPI